MCSAVNGVCVAPTANDAAFRKGKSERGGRGGGGGGGWKRWGGSSGGRRVGDGGRLAAPTVASRSISISVSSTSESTEDETGQKGRRRTSKIGKGRE